MRIDELQLARDQFRIPQSGQIFLAGNKKYEIGGRLGDGAIGVVRRAINSETGQLCAVKFLAPELKYIEQASLEDIYSRFRREGNRGIHLRHDNLVEILGYEENADCINFVDGPKPYPCNPFILMEFVSGRTLEDHIKKNISRGETSPGFTVNKQTLTIAYRVAEALTYLHSRSLRKEALVHRDVKPANIFLSKAPPGTIPSIVKLGDFGIVKWGDFRASISTGTLTFSGQAGLGTLKYMPPEQSLDPKSVGVKSDIYSLGITLYELFTNQILPSVHHVFQVKEVRLSRMVGTRTFDGKLTALKLGPLPTHLRDAKYLFEMILDMFLAPSGRPNSMQVCGAIKYLLGKYDDASEDDNKWLNLSEGRE